jgi:hypothetical protein
MGRGGVKKGENPHRPAPCTPLPLALDFFFLVHKDDVAHLEPFF